MVRHLYELVMQEQKSTGRLSMQEISAQNWQARMADHLAIATGAMLGVSLRWFIGTALNTSISFPFGTLIVNLIGCFLIGAAQTALREYLVQRVRLILVVGLLGGFTTFSTLCIETIQLLMARRIIAALMYQGLTISAGLGAVVIGSAIMHCVIRRRVRGWDK
jgi:CrcB protein